MAKSIMDYPTVDFDRENNKLVIIDQTKLPETIEMLRLDKQEDIFEAIYLLKVRGAPAIGDSRHQPLHKCTSQPRPHRW